MNNAEMLSLSQSNSIIASNVFFYLRCRKILIAIKIFARVGRMWEKDSAVIDVCGSSGTIWEQSL